MAGKLKTLPHLTGFRALAALLVLFAHSADSAFIYQGISFYHEYFAAFAYLGMSVFFVLSGFVITYNYYESFTALPWRKAAYRFAIARFARLYPLYFFITLLMALPIILSLQNIPAILSFLTLTQSWMNRQSYMFAPSWSVSTEWFFYVAFALYMLISKPWRHTANYARMRCCMLIFMFAFFGLLALIFICRDEVTALLDPWKYHAGNPNVWLWAQYFSPYTRIGEFIMGAFAARLYMLAPERSGENRPLVIASIVFLLGLLAYGIAYYGYDNFGFFLSTNFAAAPALAYLVYDCSRRQCLFGRFLGSKTMTAIGETSYSVYLLQFPVYGLLRTVVHTPGSISLELADYLLLLLKMLVFMGVTLVIARLSYRFVEIPARSWIRRKFAA